MRGHRLDLIGILIILGDHRVVRRIRLRLSRGHRRFDLHEQRAGGIQVAGLTGQLRHVLLDGGHLLAQQAHLPVERCGGVGFNAVPLRRQHRHVCLQALFDHIAARAQAAQVALQRAHIVLDIGQLFAHCLERNHILQGIHLTLQAHQVGGAQRAGQVGN